MPKSTDYKPRLSIEITEEQFFRKQKLMPFYGIQKALFGIILDEVLDIIEQRGLDFIGPLLEKRVGLNDILPTMKGKESDTGRDNQTSPRDV